jgi:hypothetical protein
VVILGDWKWGGRAPWKRLPEDPDATRLTAAEMDDALRILTGNVKPDFSRTSERPAEGSTRRTSPVMKRIEAPAPESYDTLGPPAQPDTGGAR